VIGSTFEQSLPPTGYRFAREVIAVAVRWYLRYGLSYRDVEGLLIERGVETAELGPAPDWPPRRRPLRPSQERTAGGRDDTDRPRCPSTSATPSWPALERRSSTVGNAPICRWSRADGEGPDHAERVVCVRPAVQSRGCAGDVPMRH
jgi:hypothetical protein